MRKHRLIVWLFVAPLAALVLALLLWPRSRLERPRAAPDLSPSDALAPTNGRPPERARPAAPAPRSDAPCRAHASSRCFEGDVWWVDGCGELEEPREECGARLCERDTCAARDETPCTAPLEGRCEGDRVSVCIAGRTEHVDCAARGLRCVMGPEGAECVPEVPRGERCSARLARCEDDVLVGCEAGRITRHDCAEEGAHCAHLPGAREPACVRLALPSASLCGPCGCEPVAGARETACDGRDEDGDGLIDEGLDCGSVAVTAFVVHGVAGTSHSDEDIEEELARVNRLFAGDAEEPPIHFELAEIVPLRDDSLRTLSNAAFSRLVDDPRLMRASFHVPVLFTDRLESEGGVPRVGVSTLPNGTCGGVHWGEGPELGLVAVAKGRAETTLAHELGHFLGLCHTHETRADASLVAVEQRGALAACGAPCEQEGDGVCDTPFDPGPPACRYDAACEVSCERGDEPDPANLMSYYTLCRAGFSAEQVARMQHTLALRRAWQPCLGARCACTLASSTCPEDMSCRPLQSREGEVARCTLDGPLPPGASCRYANSCGKDALCLHETGRGVQRCVRLCTGSRPDCRCTDTHEGTRICANDLD